MPAPDFLDAWTRASAARILMSQAEAAILWTLAENPPGLVVEVGSAFGGSAILLASRGPVVCVDPFAPEVIPDTPLLGPHRRDLADCFQRNVAAAPWSHRIRWRQAFDHDLWPTWTEPDGLLFLDHEHTHAAVARSLAGWRPHLAPAAVVAIHDYAHPAWPGVQSAVEASGLQINKVVDSLAIGRW